MPLTGNGGETLHCRVEDVDEISAADFMGSTEGIDLSQLAPNTITRKWYSLQPEDPLTKKKCKGDVHGDVELVILWRYNVSLDWDPFDRGNVSDGPVNELRIAAFRGRTCAASTCESWLKTTPHTPAAAAATTKNGSWWR